MSKSNFEDEYYYDDSWDAYIYENDYEDESVYHTTVKQNKFPWKSIVLSAIFLISFAIGVVLIVVYIPTPIEDIGGLIISIGSLIGICVSVVNFFSKLFKFFKNPEEADPKEFEDAYAEIQQKSLPLTNKFKSLEE